MLEYLADLTDTPLCWSKLLKDLGANTPASGLFDLSQQTNVKIISDIIEKGIKSSDDFKTLSTVCPALYNVLHQDISEKVLNAVRPMMKHVISRALVAFNHEMHIREMASDDWSNEGEFPLLPVKYKRGSFAKDKTSQKIDRVCDKKMAKHKSLSPGIFTVSCSHGKLFLKIDLF